MAQQLQRVRVLAGDDLDLGVRCRSARQIPQLAVDLDGERRLGQARADRGGDLGPGHGAGKLRACRREA